MYNSEIQEVRGRVVLVTTLSFSKFRLYSVDECNTSVGNWCKDNDTPVHHQERFVQAVLQIWYVVIRVVVDTSSRYKAVGRTLLPSYTTTYQLRCSYSITEKG